MLARLFVLASLLLALVAAGCSSSDSGGSERPDGPFATVASSDLVVGDERLLVIVRNEDGSVTGGPATPATFRIGPEGDRTSVAEVDADFTWIVPEAFGLYRADVDFSHPGLWSVAVDLGGAAIPATTFIVKEDAATPVPGEAAPRSATPTAADSELEDITSDPQPDLRFYELSLQDALSNGRPTVVVFATPAYCTTEACGPMLDQMKQLSPDWPDVNWVHVEVFSVEIAEHAHDEENPPPHAHDATLSQVPAVIQWGLPTEPWVFVVDPAGIVAARFEGTVAPEEVERVLEGLA